MKVTSKGQVTIPQEVREELGICPGAEVEFVVENGTARIIPQKAPSAHARRIVDRLRGTGTVRMTTDEIMALTRG